MARDRPSPYGEGDVAGFPRERWSARTMARDRPSPYVKGGVFFPVARGPRMPHAHPSGFHRDVEGFMKHPQVSIRSDFEGG